jgi:hypothetical protein
VKIKKVTDLSSRFCAISRSTALMMEAASISETSENLHQSTRHIPEDSPIQDYFDSLQNEIIKFCYKNCHCSLLVESFML